MATRVIVTSQPDVACDVCARRLLRGEQPDVFLAAGRRLVVCELCAPRATFEGWLRESEMDGLTLPEARPRRGRSLFDRLLKGGRPTGERVAPVGERQEAGEAGAALPYDMYAGSGGKLDVDLATPVGADAPLETEPRQPAAPPYFEEALAVFNASGFPRRVAGVARSLGPPIVSVHSAEHLSSVVRVVVAWELCWYRYEVDLSVEEPVAQVLAQGSELSELEHGERVGNAAALESGLLALAG
jgi:hypothetical protein